jgi:hypothetical protein
MADDLVRAAWMAGVRDEGCSTRSVITRARFVRLDGKDAYR